MPVIYFVKRRTSFVSRILSSMEEKFSIVRNPIFQKITLKTLTNPKITMQFQIRWSCRSESLSGWTSLRKGTFFPNSSGQPDKRVSCRYLFSSSKIFLGFIGLAVTTHSVLLGFYLLKRIATKIDMRNVLN